MGKIDIIKYPYPLIKKVVVIDGIRMLSKEDNSSTPNH